jgi:hypothetical protein
MYLIKEGPSPSFKVNYIKPMSLLVTFEFFECKSKNEFTKHVKYKSFYKDQHVLQYIEFPSYPGAVEFRIAFVNINPNQIPKDVENKLIEKVRPILTGQDEIPNSPYRIPSPPILSLI